MREEVSNEPTATPPFHQRFNIEVSLDDAKRNFVNRVLNLIEVWLPQLQAHYSSRKSEYDRILELVAARLGKRYESNHRFEDYTNSDFIQLLHALEALYSEFEHFKTGEEGVLEKLVIAEALSQSEIDLGVEWRGGSFWPSGAKLLDEALINENLKWLSDRGYDNVLAPFEKGLRDFLEAHRKPERLADTITDMYEAFEALAKVVTGRDRDLSANAELFVSTLKLSNYYKKMLKDYISYACEYRHAVDQDRQRVPPIPQEVEAFIYTTGLFIRLAIERLASDKLP